MYQFHVNLCSNAFVWINHHTVWIFKNISITFDGASSSACECSIRFGLMIDKCQPIDIEENMEFQVTAPVFWGLSLWTLNDALKIVDHHGPPIRSISRRRIRPWQKANWPPILCVPKLAKPTERVPFRSGLLEAVQWRNLNAWGMFYVWFGARQKAILYIH